MANADALGELAEAEEPRAAPQAQGSLGAVLRPGGADVTEVLLIRHGQMPPTHDTRTDAPLTETGLRQAEVLGRFLARRPLHGVYSSPMLRARQTAEAIAQHFDLEVITIDDLREMEFYLPEGAALEQLYESEEYKALNLRFQKERRWEVYGDLRESGTAIRRRVTAAIDQLVVNHKGERIAVVSHSPVINCYLAAVVDSPYDSFASIQLTGVSTVLAAEDRRRVLTVNSRAHFGV